MRTVDLERDKPNLQALIDLARNEPVLLLTPDGTEYCISQADDFDKEVETLRASKAFQRFLDERSRAGRRISLEEIERELL